MEKLVKIWCKRKEKGYDYQSGYRQTFQLGRTTTGLNRISGISSYIQSVKKRSVPT
ncbi:hypothetical protein DPMN_073321 [Dreissena polymorpha]|uniref:Uncharacterized protein n=1 Tax=Dreissena polymorpha TaxID=45954 RepID=A0A9D4BYU7_DREPO|nr:hypothetical protein DPMN_073321 [Dreissena polymorpha]